MSHDARLEDLVILNGATVSNVVTNPVGIQNIVEMLIYGPSAIDGTTITVQVAPVDENIQAADWRNFQFVPGTDVTIGAGKAVRVAARYIKAIRLLAGTTQTADRVFPIVVQQDT